MIDLGDWQIGQEVSVVCQALDSNREPAWPDQAPHLALFNEGTLISRTLMPAASQAQIPGLFRLPVFLNDSFPSSGPITGYVQWLSAGVAYAEPVFLRILPGGDSIGQIISMTFVKRPDVGHLLWQVDSGSILRGSNPRVIR